MKCITNHRAAKDTWDKPVSLLEVATNRRLQNTVEPHTAEEIASLNKPWYRILVFAFPLLIALAACGQDESSLTVYSGRSESLVGPLLDAFEEETGIEIRVKYAGSAAIASTILEEGRNSPADVVFLQEPGSLGALSSTGILATLPGNLLEKVDSRFRSPKGEWVGTSGRARTVVYNTSTVDPDSDLPSSILDFNDPVWKGRVGWAPPNGSFQAFVTALRVQHGDSKAREWLLGMKANDARDYPKNTAIVDAVARGEVDVGFVNHYYLERFLQEEGPGFGARNYFLGGGDSGALVLVAGAGVLNTSDNTRAAERFVEYLLSESAQAYFASETREYPLIAGVEPQGDMPPLSSLEPPDLDLSNLSDIQGTLSLMREVGVLP